MLSKNIYRKLYKSWNETFEDKKVNLDYSCVSPSWKNFFDIMNDNGIIEKINTNLTNELEGDVDGEKLYPYPDLVFKAFELTPFDEIKVVFIGQDPYFNNELDKNEKIVPQAMGLSFSVPYGHEVPCSLKNIYKNLKKFKHIATIPEHGNLEFWAQQGCFMLNTSLTVIDGEKNCHQKIWSKFTTECIKYISEKTDKVVFVIWGADALEKAKYIDLDKHDMIISSHPSGLSAAKPLRNYPSFNEFDHFGKINEKLEEFEKSTILWYT